MQLQEYVPLNPRLGVLAREALEASVRKQMERRDLESVGGTETETDTNKKGAKRSEGGKRADETREDARAAPGEGGAAPQASPRGRG